MEFQRVSKKAKKKWIVSRIIALIFVMLPLAAFCVFIGKDIGGSTALYISYAIAAILVLMQVVNILVYPPIEYIQWQYMIADDRIEIKKGIFYRSHTVIPISRIQHVTVTQGVLQRPFMLSTVQIHTAGSVMEIQELDTEVAEDICSRLQKRVNVKVEAKQDAHNEQ